jgi:diguanylate cyclase (GGDEF)-like protein/PAS domain S-box-containing protein
MDHHRSGAHNGGRQGTRVDSEALWDWNLKSDRIHFSPRWIALLGGDDHEVGSTPDEWFERVHPDDRAQLTREIESARSGDSTAFAFRHRLRHKDGTYRWMSCTGAVVRDRAGQAIRLTGSHSDVTVEMVSDRLTGLPNRLLLVDRVTHSIERSRRYKGFHFAVLVIDLGRPPRPGGRAGKANGDPLLTAVARRLETCLRVPETMPSLRHNDLVARLDGDYFAILLDGLKEISHAKIVADRILCEILNPFTLGGREVRLSASIGIALSPTGYTNADEVLHDAVTALHRAHVLGGSHCEVFDTEILKTEQAELQLEGDFEAALQRGDFELFYQPIVSLASNEVLGFEALVRWRHPVLGMIAPADFVPIAERTGFIVPLGNWILREACLQLSAWQNGLPLSSELSISVNLSSVQFTHATLVDEIAEALRDAGLEPQRLVLELTEGVAMADPTAVTTLLMRLRAMGVRISVDDFGTGYSSLAYLRQFPIDTLKFDRSFVRGMVTNKDTAGIVASLIGMSRQLGLHVVAEGIEHEDQLAQLRGLTCEAGQGDLFAKPLDVDQAAELLKTGLAPQPQRQRSANASVSRDEEMPSHWSWTRLLMASNRVAVAVMALALLLSAGMVVALTDVRPAPEPSRASVTEVKQPASVEASVIAAPSAPPPISPISPASLATSVPKARSAAMPPSPAPATPLLSAISPAPLATVPPVLPAKASVDVVHLHRLGNCRGRLEVTREGVAFVSAEDGGDEAFTLRYTEFLHALSDDTLTLKSATRTYRFKTAASGGENAVRLRDLADRIERSRR